MYAVMDNTAPSSQQRAARPTRASLKSRPRIQRACIRSWEYIRPVRVSILVVRMLVALWLVFLGVVLLSAGYTWGFTLFPAAGAVLAAGLWMFAIADRGWPVDEA
jgi:glycine/D-amino acid oxidase-like deaminating enzyme